MVGKLRKQLILAARQWGYLQSIPEQDLGNGKTHRWKDTRANILIGLGKELPMVDLPAGEFYLDALFHAGPIERDAMGNEKPISWSEVYAYGNASGIVTEPWEFDLLRSMSLGFMEGKTIGRDPLGRAPIDPPENDEESD